MPPLGSHIDAISQHLVAVLCVLTLYILCRSAAVKRKDLPPGPKRALFFGNALQFPKLGQHLKMAEWARQYGRLCRYTTGGEG